MSQEIGGRSTTETAAEAEGLKTQEEAIASIETEAERVADENRDRLAEIYRQVVDAAEKTKAEIESLDSLGESVVAIPQALGGGGGAAALVAWLVNQYRNSTRRRELKDVRKPVGNGGRGLT